MTPYYHVRLEACGLDPRLCGRASLTLYIKLKHTFVIKSLAEVLTVSSHCTKIVFLRYSEFLLAGKETVELFVDEEWLVRK